MVRLALNGVDNRRLRLHSLQKCHDPHERGWSVDDPPADAQAPVLLHRQVRLLPLAGVAPDPGTFPRPPIMY